MLLLTFDYINHRGELHRYAVRPKTVQFSACQCFQGEPDRQAWNITCDVVLRDGEPRPGERSFAIIKMNEVAEITAP